MQIGVAQDGKVTTERVRQEEPAEQALIEQNLLFAATLADKAGAIAVLLQRR